VADGKRAFSLLPFPGLFSRKRSFMIPVSKLSMGWRKRRSVAPDQGGPQLRLACPTFLYLGSQRPIDCQGIIIRCQAVHRIGRLALSRHLDPAWHGYGFLHHLSLDYRLAGASPNQEQEHG
jgi:hypothetical protein